jgi:putative IMPACT (imprinted ancient) family translation regulator
MVLKEGCTGLEGPDDFRLREGNNDDGERWGGERILGVLRKQGIIDAVVVCSRWFALFPLHIVLTFYLLCSL